MASRTRSAGGSGRPAVSDPAAIEVSVLIAAEPSTVFRFLSDPARFVRWMGQGASIEACEGGVVRAAYPGGRLASGRVVEVVENRRLVFTYGYETGHASGRTPGTGDQTPIPAGSTRVEITLTPGPDGTLVTLRHTGLPTEAARRGHVGGWKYYTAALAHAASAEQHAVALPGAIEAYYAAWNETDAGTRRSLLERSVEPDIRFAGPYGLTQGIDDLDAHIANAQRFMPGMRLEAAAPAQECHGWARSAWRVTGGGEGGGGHGAFVATGVNVVRLSARTRAREIVGFWDPPAAG